MYFSFQSQFYFYFYCTFTFIILFYLFIYIFLQASRSLLRPCDETPLRQRAGLPHPQRGLLPAVGGQGRPFLPSSGRVVGLQKKIQEHQSPKPFGDDSHCLPCSSSANSASDPAAPSADGQYSASDSASCPQQPLHKPGSGQPRFVWPHLSSGPHKPQPTVHTTTRCCFSTTATARGHLLHQWHALQNHIPPCGGATVCSETPNGDGHLRTAGGRW